MRVHDVVESATADAPPIRSSVDDIVAAGQRVQRRQRMGWAATGVATLAVIGVAAVSVPALVTSPDRDGAGTQAAAANQAGSAKTAWTALSQPYSFTFKKYDVGRYHVSDPVTASTAYELAMVTVDGPQPAEVTAYLALYRPGAFNPAGVTGAKKVTVAGRPALHRIDSVPALRHTLAWEYADGAWAALYAISPDRTNPPLKDLQAVAAGLKPAATATTATVPFTLSYVPNGYQPAEVGSGVWAGVLGVTGVSGEPLPQVAGANFAKSVPTTGLVKPLSAPEPVSGKTTGPDFPNGFQLFISDGSKGKGGLSNGQKPPAEPRCGDGFCDFWSADGSLRAQVSSEGQLSNAEMSKILKGITFATSDRATWVDAAKAFPGKP